MTGKTRMLGAGRAGSTSYGSNVNLVQFGNKLQGLAPQATHFFIAGNGPAGWVNYQTRTYAPKRNFVFCMNRLGGIGRGKSQFKIGGLNNPDGSRSCKPYDYIKQKETFEEKNILTKKLSNKLEKDSQDDLESSTGSTSELKTDIYENKNEFLGKSRFYINRLNQVKYSSDEPPSRFTNGSGDVNDALKINVSQINGSIVRITTPYPLQETELDYFLSNFSLELPVENDAIKLNYSFNNSTNGNNGVNCANGKTGGYSYSTTYILINIIGPSPICDLLNSTYIQFIPPNDLIFLETQQVITSDPSCISTAQSYDVSPYPNSETSDIIDDINVLVNNGNSMLDINKLDGYTKYDLDIYKLDEISSSTAWGSGNTLNGCLNTYLIMPFCTWLSFFPNVLYDFNNNDSFTIIKMRRDIFKSQNPYSTEEDNSPYISLILDWGDNNIDGYQDFSGTKLNTVPEANILFSHMVAGVDDDYIYIVATNNAEFYNSAIYASNPTILNNYNLPPLIKLTTEEGNKVNAFLLSTTQITNLGLILRLRNPSGDLEKLMNDLECYPDPESNLNQNYTKVLNGQLNSYINAQIYTQGDST